MTSANKSYRIEYDHLPEMILTPGRFRSHHVAVIIQLLETGNDITKRVGGSLARFAGAWKGEALVREEQGKYEIRSELE